MSSSIRDVAERAGVSIATVSRVMNDRPDVGVATRERVLGVARELGYVAHGPARALTTSRSQLAGIVLPPGVTRREVVLTFFGEVIDSVARHLDQHGYDSVLLRSSPPGHGFYERVARHAMEGLLLMGSIDAGDFAEVPDELPCVGVDVQCSGPNRGSVIFDDADGIRLCLLHLYALGHRRIAYLGGPPTFRPAADRLARSGRRRPSSASHHRTRTCANATGRRSPVTARPARCSSLLSVRPRSSPPPI